RRQEPVARPHSKVSGAEYSRAFRRRLHVDAPDCRSEIAGIAGLTNQLYCGVPVGLIPLRNSVRHPSPFKAVTRRSWMRQCVEFGSYYGRAWRGQPPRGNASVPLRQVGDILKEVPHVLGRLAYYDTRFQTHFSLLPHGHLYLPVSNTGKVEGKESLQLAERQERGNDVACGARTRQPHYVLLHLGESLLVVHQGVDLIGQRRQIVAADRDPFFKQMIGVAFLLARYRVDDDQHQSPSQGL